MCVMQIERLSSLRSVFASMDYKYKYLGCFKCDIIWRLIFGEIYGWFDIERPNTVNEVSIFLLFLLHQYYWCFSYDEDFCRKKQINTWQSKYLFFAVDFFWNQTFLCSLKLKSRCDNRVKHWYRRIQIVDLFTENQFRLSVSGASCVV